ncbi:uncharacterized protein isoform X2 [Leptinotarsa decemlineata]|uniref:uncharacterized protein isoform X2 n=1 Tax=Leptinotarsa decemlineata TaxID=7539 RepID=UPI003D3090F6
MNSLMGYGSDDDPDDSPDTRQVDSDCESKHQRKSSREKDSIRRCSPKFRDEDDHRRDRRDDRRDDRKDNGDRHRDRDRSEERTRHNRDDEKPNYRDDREEDREKSSRDDDRARDRGDRLRERDDNKVKDRRDDRRAKSRERYSSRDDRYRKDRDRRRSRSPRDGRDRERRRSRSPRRNERSRSRSRDRNSNRGKGGGFARRFGRGYSRTDDTDNTAGASARSEENPTGGDATNKDRFFVPGITGRFREQIEKRKLLWQKKEPEKQETVVKPAPSFGVGGSRTTKVWEATTFAQDTDGKVANKFKRLMGIKSATDGNSTATEVLKKQEEMFTSMEQQYEVARTATHTMRGVGLGFGSYPR